MVNQKRLHVKEKYWHSRRLEWRTSCRRLHDSTAGFVWSLFACCRRNGYVAIPQIHGGRFWTDDYGCSEASQPEFEALYKYSPYHNIKDGVEYPPTLVTTADTDDRVVPGHSFKFAARLQEAQAGPNPTLIRIETKAGHGAGKPTSKRIEEAADMWAFLAKHLELKPDLPGGE